MQRTNMADPPKVRVAHLDPPNTRRAVRLGSFKPVRIALVGVAAVLLALVAAYSMYGMSHDGRVYRGVQALGQNLGGMSRAEAVTALTTASASYSSAAVTLNGSGRTWTFSPAELGAGVDVAKTVDTAMRVGRAEGFFNSLGAQWGALTGNAQIAPILKHDAALVDGVVAKVAADVDRPVANSKLEQGPDGKVYVTPSSVGVIVDRLALRDSLVASLAAVPFAPVSVAMREEAPQVTEAALKASEAQALLITEQPIVLKSGELEWTLEPAQLRGMLTLAPGANANEWTAALNGDAVTAYLKPVADELHKEPVDADVVIGKSTVTLKEDKSGADLDVLAAVAAISGASVGKDTSARTVELPVNEVPAAVQTEAVRALYDKANALVTQGMRVRYADDGYILRGASVAGFMSVERAQGGPSSLKLVIDEDVLANRISGVGYYINRPASDARFRMVDGAPKKITGGREGLKVNVAQSTQNALKAIDGYAGGDRLQVDLEVAVTEPSLKDSDIASINTPDLLATGTTSYAGSSPARRHNVDLGVALVNGALVPPGGVFSTNDTVGDLTLEAGFQMGYGIITTSKGVTTVPSEAGGICQVSTTLFHAVFKSGLQVVERNWHSYWINTYTLTPYGRGLDATISPPDKDFRFKNNTGNWVLIKATADGKNVNFALYGVDPGWSVKVGEAVITNVVETTQERVTETTDTLPKGKEVQVERAQNGFNSSITRTVTDSEGKVIDQWTAKSRYAPSRNRFLVGK